MTGPGVARTQSTRLVIAALVGIAAGAAQVLPQRVLGALDPAPADVLVGAGLAVVTVLLARRTRPAPAVLVGGAAAAWILVGAAPLVDGPLEDPLLRLALLPHALLVAATMALPSGRLDTRSARVVAAAAVVVALAAGTGRLPLPLAAVGAVALVAALRLRDPAVAGARACLGALLVGVDVLAALGTIRPAGAGVAVGVGLLATAAALPRLLDRETRLWEAAADDELLGARLGRALGTGPLVVAIPIDQGAVDPAGRAIEPPADAVEVRASGRAVALLAPSVHIDPALAPAVAGLLERVGAVARSRARRRELAADLERSRHVLLHASDDERQLLEQRVSTGVGARIGLVRERLIAAGASADLVATAERVQHELGRIGAPPPLSDSDAFAAGLGRVAAAEHLEVDVRLPDPPPAAIADLLWFACSEGLANATKHAAGAAVRIAVTGDLEGFTAVVDDDGPGGARPDGAGLRGLADRAADLGGTCTVTSTPGGTRLVVRVPHRDCVSAPAPLRGTPDPLPSAAS